VDGQSIAIGVAAGLLAAACHSVFYLLSRHFVMGSGRTGFHLFAMSHALMAVVSAAAIPLLWSPSVPPLRTYAGPLLASCAFYLLGQLGLFTALRRSDASRIAPLLGLKILMLALIAFAGLHVATLRDLLALRPLAWLQWVAVGACVAAAFVLNAAGGRIPAPAVLSTLLAAFAYCLSDLSIGVLVGRLQVAGAFRGTVYGCACTYLLCGLVGLPLALPGRRPERAAWRAAVPVAVFWLLAMVFLYIAFKFIGVLFGNVMQATRGIISVALGASIARWGLFPELETRVTRAVFRRRLIAAVLMCAGIAAFLISKG
jgi:drug/metabolite transporter (DMT)-like permease